MDTADAMFKMDKTAFSVASLFDEPDEKAYWQLKTPYERLRRRLSWLFKRDRPPGYLDCAPA